MLLVVLLLLKVLVLLTEFRMSRQFGFAGQGSDQLKFASSHCVTPLSNNKTQVAVETGATVAPFDDT